MRVLVVEDEPAIAESLEFLLGVDGHRVCVARTGSEAWPRFQAFFPEVVLLDLMLPGVNGLEVCRRIRGVSDVAIIILTARAAEAERVVGLEAGADDYLTKPFSHAELLARMRAVTRRRDIGQRRAAVTAGIYPQPNRPPG